MKLGLAPVLVVAALALVGCGPSAADAPVVEQAPASQDAAFLEDGKLKVNDGLVTVESSKWGTFQQCVAADHLKEVGQLGALASSFDHRALFRDIVSRLRTSGL